jgi:hypothetical protein
MFCAGREKAAQSFSPRTSISRSSSSKRAPVLPSVIQLRLDDVRPQSIGQDVLLVLERHREDLERGALITLKGRKSRLRLLPLKD